MLVGDSCTDEYQFGKVDRISPEAPVPVFDYLYSEYKPGMGSNVKKNLEALGCKVDFLTCGESRKIRFIDAKTRQQIIRVDHDNISKETVRISEDKNSYDAVVIADYDKGAVKSETLIDLKKFYNGPVYVDTKKIHLTAFEGYFVKINEKERERCHSLCSNLIVTLGDKGACYNNKNFSTRLVEVADVCGAGDTFLASLCYFHLETGNIETAIEYANKASSITVNHFGTYAPTLEEIKCV